MTGSRPSDGSAVTAPDQAAAVAEENATSAEQTSHGASSETLKAVKRGRTALAARDAIKALIQDGVFEPNQKLPGERDLAETVHVSRAVLRSALASLEEDGYVESSPWRGWFVCGPEMSERVTLTSFTEMARSRGLVPTTSVLSSAVRAAMFPEASALAVAPASPVLEVHRLRRLDGVPACTDVSIIPLAHAEGIERVSLEDASLYGVLEDVCGVRIVRSDYSVHAEASGPDEAERLGIGSGDPVLVGEETAYDAAGRAIILGRATYRSETYRFRATLFRSGTA